MVARRAEKIVRLLRRRRRARKCAMLGDVHSRHELEMWLPMLGGGKYQGREAAEQSRS